MAEQDRVPLSLGITPQDRLPPSQQVNAGSLPSLGITPRDRNPDLPPPEPQPGFDPRELPTVDPQTGADLPLDDQGRPLPTPEQVPGLQPTQGGNLFGVPIGSINEPTQDTLLGSAAPFVQPAVDVAAGVNRFATTVADAPGQLFNAASQAAGGTAPVPRLTDIPFIQRAITPSDTDGAETRALVGEFAGGGAGVNLVSRFILRDAPRVALGTDSVFRGILKDIRNTPLATEALLGGSSALGVRGAQEAGLGTAGELGAGLFAPLLAIKTGGLFRSPTGVSPATTTGQGDSPASLGDDISRLAGNARANLRATDRSRATAAELLQRETSNPAEAAALVERSRAAGRPLAAVDATEDPGIMTLGRSLARRDARLKGDLDRATVDAQKSLQDELTGVLGQSGDPDPEALGNFLASKRDELLAQQDDVIRIAFDEMAAGAKVTSQTDPIAISRRFLGSLRGMVDNEIRPQEQALWGVLNSDTIPVSLRPARERLIQFVANTNAATNLPKRELERVIGFRIRKAGDRFTVTDEPVPEALPEDTTADVLITLRSNIGDDIRRQAGNQAIGKPKDVRVLREMQSALIDSLSTANVTDPNFVKAFNTARDFSFRVRENFERGILGDVLARDPNRGEPIFPERTLKRLFESGPEDQATAARELKAALGLRQEATGQAPESSPVVRDERGFLRAKFRQEATDAERAEQFLIENRQLLRDDTPLRRQLNQATERMKAQRQRIRTAEEEKTRIGNDSFNRLIGVRPKTAVNFLLEEPNPGKASVELMRRLNESPAAQEVLRNAVAEKFLDTARVVPSLEGLDRELTKRGMIQAETQLRPLLKALGIDQAGLRQITDEVSAMTARASQTPRSIEEPRNILQDLLARMIPTLAVANLTSGSSIVLQSAAAGAGRRFVDRMTGEQVKRLLARAMTDKKLMAELLRKDLSKETVNSIRRIIPEVFVGAASQADEVPDSRPPNLLQRPAPAPAQ